MLAKAGHEVTLLEQGPDPLPWLDETSSAPAALSIPDRFSPVVHDEYVFRARKPDPKRRPRGDYNTFRRPGGASVAVPFKNGWTGSVLGGGSVIWGTWSYRALPIDLKLATHFAAEGQLPGLEANGYSVADWPIAISELAPFYELAEVLLSVNGDRSALNASIEVAPWYSEFKSRDYWGKPSDWFVKSTFPGRPFPRTPVGQFVADVFDAAAMKSFQLATAIVTPFGAPYGTGTGLENSIKASKAEEIKNNSLWQLSASDLWSQRQRDACNMCGYCGEFLCWGKTGPKSGTHVTTLLELKDLAKTERDRVKIKTMHRAVEVKYDRRSKRATGVKVIDASDPDQPKIAEFDAEYVIVSGGAVQSARLLHLSDSPRTDAGYTGLGNSTGHLGRHATFHMFGFSASGVLQQDFQGLLRGEFGPTGNTSSFWPYFIKDDQTGKWLKAGTLTSTAKKNPMDNALSKLERSKTIGPSLLTAMDEHVRSFEIRCTSDDLPMHNNRVDLDPVYVDEYGFPVARITRAFGPHEDRVQTIMAAHFDRMLAPFKASGVLQSYKSAPAILDLLGDHQMGTCRMGADPRTSVVDTRCRVWDAPNVFVVDSSFMPSGLGLNPMITVVANALRVGSWMIKTLDEGKSLDTD
jgi:choline dehydrogenase-like flavoprotein